MSVAVTYTGDSHAFTQKRARSTRCSPPAPTALYCVNSQPRFRTRQSFCKARDLLGPILFFSIITVTCGKQEIMNFWSLPALQHTHTLQLSLGTNILPPLSVSFRGRDGLCAALGRETGLLELYAPRQGLICFFAMLFLEISSWFSDVSRVVWRRRARAPHHSARRGHHIRRYARSYSHKRCSCITLPPPDWCEAAQLVMTASLDGTVRMWSIDGVCAKAVKSWRQSV